MSRESFTIGEAARRAAVSADTIRYYERAGLLSPAPRTRSGYRLYSAEAIARIQLVKNAVRFGFSVKDLAGFLSACLSGRPCHKVRNAGARLLADMDLRITEMMTARDRVRATMAQWDEMLAATPPGEQARLLQHLPVSEVPRAPLVRRARSHSSA